MRLKEVRRQQTSKLQSMTQHLAARHRASATVVDAKCLSRQASCAHDAKVGYVVCRYIYIFALLPCPAPPCPALPRPALLCPALLCSQCTRMRSLQPCCNKHKQDLGHSFAQLQFSKCFSSRCSRPSHFVCPACKASAPLANATAVIARSICLFHFMSGCIKATVGKQTPRLVTTVMLFLGSILFTVLGQGYDVHGMLSFVCWQLVAGGRLTGSSASLQDPPPPPLASPLLQPGFGPLALLCSKHVNQIY